GYRLCSMNLFFLSELVPGALGTSPQTPGIFGGMAKVFHVLARDRDGTYSTRLVREFTGDTKKELLSREINHQNLLAGRRAAGPNGPLIPSPYSPTGKKGRLFGQGDDHSFFLRGRREQAMKEALVADRNTFKRLG
ncbi:MAG: hypothetical protein ACKOU6_02930, partial [Planctomycetota bacterium]